ncbi:hypothetical protein P12x_005851 [Tundrisphaera lichenicola]|uniref:hypothetical protein n=1 Tax=Tundrisphaera lichenicola TaxID=2029860 RepID=UPI003EB9DB6D
MKRPRITLGRLMLFVAIVGTLTWGGVSAYRGWKLASMYRSLAQYHAQHEKTSIIAVRERTSTAGPEQLAALTRGWRAYHSSMRRKYERAASFPWLRLPDDPPSPVELSNAATGREVDLHYP